MQTQGSDVAYNYSVRIRGRVEASRGAHTRADHPNSTEEQGSVNTIIKLEDGGMNVATTPLPEMSDELKKLFEEN